MFLMKSYTHAPSSPANTEIPVLAGEDDIFDAHLFICVYIYIMYIYIYIYLKLRIMPAQNYILTNIYLTKSRTDCGGSQGD